MPLEGKTGKSSSLLRLTPAPHPPPIFWPEAKTDRPAQQKTPDDGKIRHPTAIDSVKGGSGSGKSATATLNMISSSN